MKEKYCKSMCQCVHGRELKTSIEILNGRKIRTRAAKCKNPNKFNTCKYCTSDPIESAMSISEESRKNRH